MYEHIYDAGLSKTRRRTTCRGELANGGDGPAREEAAAGGVEGSDVHLQRVPGLPVQVQRSGSPRRRHRSDEQRLPLQMFLPYLGDASAVVLFACFDDENGVFMC